MAVAGGSHVPLFVKSSLKATLREAIKAEL
jgi:hypothetical protein